MTDISQTPELKEAQKKKTRSLRTGWATVGLSVAIAAGGIAYGNKALDEYFSINKPPQACVQLENAHETLDILVDRRETGDTSTLEVPYKNDAVELYTGSTHLPFRYGRLISEKVLDEAIAATQNDVMRLEAHPTVREHEGMQRKRSLYGALGAAGWGMLCGLAGGFGLLRALNSGYDFRRDCREIEAKYEVE